MGSALQVVVGAALVRGGRVLAAERTYPEELAGCWELPGGKVQDGEGEPEALARECREELGVDVRVLHRVGPSLPTAGGRFLLHAWACALVDPAAEPVRREHGALRWLAADELDDVPWLDADRPLLPDLRALLAGPTIGA